MNLAIPEPAKSANRQNMRNKDKYSKVFGRGPLDNLLVATMEEWDDAKHRRISDEEVTMINSIHVGSCPHAGCGSAHIKKDGKQPRTGVQRYRCLWCGRTFTPLTGTLFDSNKIPISERLEFLIHLLEQHSVATSTRDNVNAETTGGIWTFKAFLALRGCQEGVKVNGDEVWYDEFYIPEAKSRKEPKVDGTFKRGISSDQVCVLTVTDGASHALEVSGRGKPKSEQVLSFLSKHICEGVSFHHDGDHSHRLAVNELALRDHVHYPDYGSGKEDPMEPVNTLHSYLSRFLSQHLGFKRDDSQDWVNLFWVSMSFRPLEIAAKYIIERMISTKITVRYRDFYGRNRKKFD